MGSYVFHTQRGRMKCLLISGACIRKPRNAEKHSEGTQPIITPPVTCTVGWLTLLGGQH